MQFARTLLEGLARAGGESHEQEAQDGERAALQYLTGNTQIQLDLFMTCMQYNFFSMCILEESSPERITEANFLKLLDIAKTSTFNLYEQKNVFPVKKPCISFLFQAFVNENFSENAEIKRNFIDLQDYFSKTEVINHAVSAASAWPEVVKARFSREILIETTLDLIDIAVHENVNEMDGPAKDFSEIQVFELFECLHVNHKELIIPWLQRDISKGELGREKKTTRLRSMIVFMLASGLDWTSEPAVFKRVMSVASPDFLKSLINDETVFNHIKDTGEGEKGRLGQELRCIPNLLLRHQHFSFCLRNRLASGHLYSLRNVRRDEIMENTFNERARLLSFSIVTKKFNIPVDLLETIYYVFSGPAEPYECFSIDFESSLSDLEDMRTALKWLRCCQPPKKKKSKKGRKKRARK